MTLLDIKNHLIGHFLSQSTFSLRDDLARVRLGGAYDEALAKGGALAERKEPLFRAALEDMARSSILLELDKVNGVYILNQPLNTFNQTVTVSPITAHNVAELINGFAPMIGREDHVCNKLSITDMDLNALVQLCLAFRGQLDDLLDDLEGEDGGGIDQGQN